MSPGPDVYDPTIRELNKTLSLAKETNASDKVIESLSESIKLYHQRHDFAEDMTTTDSETCKNIREETESHNWRQVFDEKKTSWNVSPIMVIGSQEGEFIKSYLSAQKVKRVLEIGMLTGYSALAIAEILPADGQVVTLDQDVYLKEMVERLVKESPHGQKIHVIIGDALKTISQLKCNDEKFDAIFLDADKKDYEAYLKLCLEGDILLPGGTILVDNAFHGGESYTEPDSPLAKFGHTVRDNPDLHVVLVPIRDGLYLIRRRVDVDGAVA